MESCYAERFRFSSAEQASRSPIPLPRYSRLTDAPPHPNHVTLKGDRMRKQPFTRGINAPPVLAIDYRERPGVPCSRPLRLLSCVC
eukprot:6185996-Pleurochrysis_carterae.AAC.1